MVDRSESTRAEGSRRVEPAEAHSDPAARTAPSMAGLQKVLDAYAEEHPNRAKGGLRALSGFDFQIRCYLADFFTNLASEEDYAAAARVFDQRFETLEDYMRRGERGCVVVQAKRRLTPTLMAEAAVEFARIEQFLADRDWDERLSYEIVASGGTRNSWEHAQTLTPFKRSPRHLQDRFAAMLSADRVLPPRIDDNPTRRLIAALWPHVDNPFSVEREAVDRCLRSSQNQPLVDQLPSEIAEIFINARDRRKERRKPPGKVLQPPDVTPSEGHPTGSLIIGQIPRLSHLRHGQFLARPHRVEEALSELDSVLVDRRGRSEAMLDVFWIKGRSGSGKSVLLLELAQELVLQGEEFVCWLGNRSDQLELLLEKWSEASQEEHSPRFVFIDDLYDTHARTRLDLRRVANLIRNKANVGWPVIVTCGPAQFEDALRYEGQDDAFYIRSWPLPLVAPAEKNKLRKWFEDRSGRTAALGPAAAEDEGLMISLMAEMAVEGNLVAFGSRFRERLEEAGLDEALRLPLALNRLYIFPPAAWLGDEERNRLDALNQDQDFTVLSAESEPGEFLRLTHPHLSNAIYRALERRSVPSVIARDLGKAFEKALETSSTVALEILSTVAGGYERLDEADPVVLRTEFCSAWNEVGRRGEIFDDRGKTWAWAHWAVWAARDADVNGEIEADTLLEVTQALERDENHPQWSTIWRTLAKSHPKERELRKFGLAWIAETAIGSDIPAGWSRMWQDLVDTTKERSELDWLLSLGETWLEGREGRREWSFVWGTLVRFGYALPKRMEFSDLLEVGWEWLRWPWGQGRADWPHVWQELVAQGGRLPDSVPIDELVQDGRNWVLEKWRQDLRQWPYMWGTLLDLEEEILPQVQWLELYELGHDWLLEERRKLEPSWPHVWERLVTAAESYPEVERSERILTLGWEWLCGGLVPGSSGWPRVWSKLLAIGPADLPHEVNRDQLLEKGRQWIEAESQEPGPHTQYVWQGLLQVEPERTIATAEQWLRDHELPFEEASFLLQPLLEYPHLNEDDARSVVEAALRWLSSHLPVPEATFVLKPLLKRGDLCEHEAEKAIERAVEWLAELRTHFGATHVIQPLFGRQELTKEQEKEGVEAGVIWLEHHGPVVEAQYILGPLLAPNREGLGDVKTGQLIGVALDWLRLHADGGPVREARYFLGALLERDELTSKQAEQAVNAALAWLSEYHAVPEARFVLAPLLRRLERFESDPLEVAQAIRWAVEWLQEKDTARTAEDESLVLCAALKIANVQIDVTNAPSSDEKKLLVFALEWTNRRIEEKDTRFVLRRLLSKSNPPSGGAARRVETLALTWLRRFPKHENVDYFYTRVLRRSALPDDEWKEVAAIAIADLRQRAYRWHRSYAFRELKTRMALLPEADREWLQGDFEQWEKWNRETAESRPP